MIELYRGFKIPRINMVRKFIEYLNEQKMLAPNGKTSNLTPQQYDIVRTKEFKKWFGDWENNPDSSSQVVDENGEPLVVYHRTYSDFHEFNNNKANYKKGFVGGNLFYFSDDRYGYSDYGDREIECFINLRNPAYKVNIGGKYLPDSNDGAILKFDRFGDKENMIIATKSNQIKLADGKNTTFTDSNDIRL